MGVSASGLALARAGSTAALVWLVPLAGGATLAAGLLGKPQRTIARISGIAPFLCIAVWTARGGGGQVLSSLGIGAYLALVAGLALIFLIPTLGKQRAS
jgi:hypothetical protein